MSAQVRGDVAERIDAPPARRDDHAVDDVELLGRRLQQLAPPSPAPWRAAWRAAIARRRCRSSPWRARHARRCRTRCGRSGRGRRARGDNRRPSVSAQICAIAVSNPWPTEAPPVTTSTAPVGIDRDPDAVASGRARSSRQRWRCPRRPASPAARRRASSALQRLPADTRRAPCRAGPRSRRNRRRPRRRARRAGGANGISAAAIRLRRRTSIGSSPSRSATASISRSRTKLPLVAAGRAVGRRRRLVGQAEMADRADRPGRGRARAACRRHLGDARAVGAHIGALVEKELVLQAEHAPFGIDRGADVVALLARMVGRHQCSRRSSIHLTGRPSRSAASADQNILGIELAANAEAAADMALVQHASRRRCARACGRARRGCDAAPWRRRTAPARRAPRRSARSRRASPAARR